MMENPELTAVDVLFVREHNWWVAALSHEHTDWSGQQLYDMAKAITTAEYQNIIYKEFLPVLIGNAIRPYRGYNSSCRGASDPGILHRSLPSWPFSSFG